MGLRRITSRPTQAPRARPESFGGGEGRAAYGEATQDVSDALLTIHDARESARLASVLAKTAAEAERLKQDAENDQDIDTLDKRYEREMDRIITQARSGFRGDYARAFDQRAFEIKERGSLAVRESIIKRSNDQTRAYTQDTLDSLSKQAGATEDEGDRKMLVSMAAEALARGRGAFSEQEIGRMARDWEEDVEMGTVRRDMRINAEAALSRLLAGKYKLGPERRQVLIEQAQNELERELNRDAAEARRARAEQRRRDKEAANTAVFELYKKASPGAEGITQADLDAAAPAFARAEDGAKKYRDAQEIISNGGFLRDSISDPPTYNELVDLLDSGVDIRSMVDDAYHAGRLSPSDASSLRDRSGVQKRYREAFAFLREPPMDTSMFSSAEQRAQWDNRRFQGLLEFTDWVNLNNPSVNEANKKAQEIAFEVTSALVADAQSSTLPVDPNYAVRDEAGNVMVAESGLRAFEAFKDGRLDLETYRTLLTRLDAIDRAQKIFHRMYPASKRSISVEAPQK